MMEAQPKFLDKLYSRRFTGVQEYRNQVWQVLCSEFFAAYVPAQSRVLDLGAGWGEFINNIVAGEKFAMDLNPATGSHLSAGISFIHQDCSQPWPLESESLDVVFTSNFLEHLPDKASVQRTMSEAYRCLREGGRIIYLGPNIRYLQREYWDFWDHSIPITDLSCIELLTSVGFSIDLSLPRFLPYSMSTGRRHPLALVRLYVRLPLLWRFFGKQFLAIGRKTANGNRSDGA
jgi:SAM-dependent methyltransferase